VDILVLTGVILDWVIRIGALFVVPKNRKPSSATAWLMLILLLPFLGLIIFILLGSPKLNKKRRRLQKNMDETIANILKSEESKHRFSEIIVDETSERYGQFIKLNKNLSGFPAFSNNKIELLDDYDGAIKSIANDMKKADKFIHIEYFIIVMDSSTEILFEQMELAIQRGVKVRVLFDAIGTKGYPNFEQMKSRLSTIGVDWHPMLPLSKPGENFNRPDLRNHRKIVVIDGIYGYTGSQNLVTRNYHRSDELYYDELVARIQGPIVAQLQAAFITDWYSETETLLSREKHPELEIQLKPAGNALAQILPSGPGFDNDNNLKLFTSLIHSAKEKITIVNPYFVPEDSLINAITSAAQRDVKVVMINSKIMDQVLVGHAQRSYFEELLKAGVEIYQYDLPILLHSKYLTIDNDIAVIGSSNLDMRSFQLDLEVTLVAYDTSVVKALHRVTASYLKRSQKLYLAKWQKRPLKTRLFENLARLTSAVQ
jgi:cardiolipin synthase A/B